MGAFYGSIHIRSTDVELVKAGLQKFCKGTKNRFLVSPAIRGWIGIYPNEHGADFASSESIAKECGAPVLHCMVHDDDVFTYRLYHLGTLLDEYSSHPGCFDESIEPGAEPTGGRVELLETVLPLNGRAEQLRELLKAPHAEFTFEQERLSRFANLIDLPNACTAYEYLQAGERDGITRWREFVHVPDLSAEKAAKKAAAARVRAELKALQREKVLVRELKQAFWCVDPATSDLLVSEPREMFGQRKPLRLFVLTKPWTGKPRDTGLDVPGTAWEIAVSASGRWMAVGHASGKWIIELWDRHSGARVLELEHKSAVSAVWFSPDEELLLSRSENEVSVISIPERRRLHVFDAGNYGAAAALHARTRYLIADARDYWRATYLDKPGTMQNLRRMPHNFHAVSSEWTFAQIQIAQLLSDEKLLEQAGRDKVEAARREWQAVGADLHEFSGTISALRFTADGKLLICAMGEGLLVFDAAEVFAAHDRLPRARFTFGLQRDFPGTFSVSESPYIYSFAEDAAQGRILFGGIKGPIYLLNLTDGTSGELFRPPEPNRIFKMALTPDRSALVLAACPPIGQKTGHAKTQIWNYEALCRARGLPY